MIHTLHSHSRMFGRSRRAAARTALRCTSLIAAAMLLASCGSDSVVEPPPQQKRAATTVRDLPADTGKTGRFTLFRLRDSSIVASADSATTAWDIGFNGTTIITNGGDRGPGNGACTLLTAVDFDALTTAPESGYVGGTVGKEWYSYTGPAGNPPHTILIVPGVVLALRTADGNYAKLQILGYYKGAPASPSGTEPARYYTFRYVVQLDGTRTLENA